MNNSYLNLIVNIQALSPLENNRAPLTDSQQSAEVIESSLSMFGYAISVESLFIGLALCVFAYLVFEYNVRLHSAEKYRIAMNMLHINHTPLTLLRSTLEHLDTKQIPEPVSSGLKEALEYTETIIDCNQTVIRLDKIDKKTKPKTSTVIFELSVYINSIVNHCRPYANSRRIRLEVNECSDCVSCKINENMMTAALLQLLNKIIQISPQGSCIYIDVGHTGDSWELHISNSKSRASGEEKAQKMLPNLPMMLPLYSYNELWTVRKVIRLHGGRMTGYGLGKTAAFRITIPTDCHCGNMSCPVIKKYSSEKHPAVKKDVHHVLLVMADPKLNGYLKEMLSAYFEISLLENPDILVDTAIRAKPEAIIIDDNVNGVSGDSLCSQVKAEKTLKSVPIILLIRSTDNEHYLSHVGSGADRLELRTESICKFRANISLLIENRIAVRQQVQLFLSDAMAPATSGEEGEENQAPALMERVNNLLEKNLAEKYTIDQLASEIGMSRSTLYGKIKEITGMAPEDYIYAFKMEKAVHYLALKQHSITEIATMVGYCDSQYFRKKFKEYYHVCPSEYIKTIIG